MLFEEIVIKPVKLGFDFCLKFSRNTKLKFVTSSLIFL